MLTIELRIVYHRQSPLDTWYILATHAFFTPHLTTYIPRKYKCPVQKKQLNRDCLL